MLVYMNTFDLEMTFLAGALVVPCPREADWPEVTLVVAVELGLKPRQLLFCL